MQDILNQLTGPEQALLLAIYRLAIANDFASSEALKSMHLDFARDMANLKGYNLIKITNDAPEITSIGYFNIKIMLLELSLDIVKKSPDKSYSWHNQKESGDAGLELAKYG